MQSSVKNLKDKHFHLTPRSVQVWVQFALARLAGRHSKETLWAGSESG